MLPPAEVQAVYEALCRAFGEAAAPIDRSALAALLARADAQTLGVPRYPSLLSKCAVTLCALAADGPFGPLNTAVAVAAVGVAVRDAGYELRMNPEEAVKFMKGVELGFTSPHRAGAWLKARLVRMPEGGEAGAGERST
ncbi:MAG TPA: hypothetical protein VFK80_11220 [Limnochordia bacterium]|nr:hypothetical protein [Limnochordia bacterium]